MATLIELNDFRDGYRDLVERVRRLGQRVAPRGQRTRELEDVTVVLKNPRDSLPLGIGRGLKPGIGVIETLQLVGSFSDPELTCRVSKHFEQFTEDDGFFWGAYGDRIGAQLIKVERKLREDPDTRQAIATLWDPWKDNQAGKRDYPCTVMLAFAIRGGRLQMKTVMRSNDVWLGSPYDFFQFTQLQLTLAAALEVPAGFYVHHALSLHLYERDFDAVDKLHASAAAPSRFGPVGFEGDFASRLSRARDLASQSDVRHLTDHEKWLLLKLNEAMT